MTFSFKRSVTKLRHKHRTKKKDHGTHFTLMYHSQLYAVKSMNLSLSKFYTWSAPLPRLGQLPWRTSDMSKMWKLDLLHFCTVIGLGAFNQSSIIFVFEVLKSDFLRKSRIGRHSRKIDFSFISPKHTFGWTYSRKHSLKFPRFILRAKFRKDRNLHVMAVFAA